MKKYRNLLIASLILILAQISINFLWTFVGLTQDIQESEFVHVVLLCTNLLAAFIILYVAITLYKVQQYVVSAYQQNHSGVDTVHNGDAPGSLSAESLDTEVSMGHNNDGSNNAPASDHR